MFEPAPIAASMACPKTGTRRRRSRRPAAQRRTAEGRCFVSRGMGRETQGKTVSVRRCGSGGRGAAVPGHQSRSRGRLDAGPGMSPLTQMVATPCPSRGTERGVVEADRNVGVQAGPHSCLPPPTNIPAVGVGSSGGRREMSSVRRDAPWDRADPYFERLPQHLRRCRGRKLITIGRPTHVLERAWNPAAETGRGFRVQALTAITPTIIRKSDARPRSVALCCDRARCQRCRQRERRTPAADTAEMQQRGRDLQPCDSRRHRKKQRDRDARVAGR